MADGKDIKVWDNHAQECKFSGRTKFEFGEHSHLWRMLHQYVKPNKDTIAVDYGCGPGYWSNLFNDCRYHGVDQSSKMIEYAKEFGPELNFTQIDNSGQTPFKKNTVDIVFTASVLQHNQRDAKHDIYEEFIRILKPGGYYLCTENTFRLDNYGPGWDKYVTDGYSYTFQGWETLLQEYNFKLIEYVSPSEYLFCKF